LDFFSTQNIAFSWLGYKMSYTELIATVLGIWATILSARRITYTWLVNLGAVLMFSIISFQLRLYADLILQAFYFVMGILGWFWWNKKAVHHHVPVGYWQPGAVGYALAVAGLAVAAALMGYLVSHFNTWMPQWFAEDAAMPYHNAVILVMSITGTFLMGRRKIENWWLWAVSNPFAAWLYYQQGSVLVCVLYLIFWIIGLTGWYNWSKEYKSQAQQ
jgi:nicotinamide mononucleotide transporter